MVDSFNAAQSDPLCVVLFHFFSMEVFFIESPRNHMILHHKYLTLLVFNVKFVTPT